ncbi:MAG: type transport system ATP-binding protein [Thermoplasmata archaeon]|nr:type transport system ATP-binding protein [Thermoplasmata archaeon]
MPALVARDLVKDFGTLRAVDGLSLEIAEGEVFGFLGPNGAGKTTSIRMMTGLLPPTAGEVEILGERVEPGGGRAKGLVGVCPQEVVLWENLTALENLAFLGEMYGMPAAKARERGQELLRMLSLDEKADARAAALSGGMKRRLNVAMALVHDPKVVVLDEPEAGLDPQARVVLREFIDGLRREKTIIFTTHNMDEAERLVDRVAIIDHGKLIALDTPANLKRRVGAGDALELTVRANAEALARRLAAMPGATVAQREATVTVRGLDLTARLPAIFREAEAAAAPIDDLRYRGNSLEDVFVTLTGRGLRE